MYCSVLILCCVFAPPPPAVRALGFLARRVRRPLSLANGGVACAYSRACFREICTRIGNGTANLAVKWSRGYPFTVGATGKQACITSLNNEICGQHVEVLAQGHGEGVHMDIPLDPGAQSLSLFFHYGSSPFADGWHDGVHHQHIQMGSRLGVPYGTLTSAVGAFFPLTLFRVYDSPLNCARHNIQVQN